MRLPQSTKGAAYTVVVAPTLLALAGSLSPVAGQEAAQQQVAQAAELPQIEVTTTAASPVVKPKAVKKSAASSAPAAPPIESLPGTTLVIAEDAFAPVTIATSGEIEATAGSTITDTLATKPGITGSSFAPGASRPIIRGLDNYRVRVQENGIGSHDVSALSEDHQVPIDPFAADRVEVVRGPATLRYGSQAIGGVVAVENQRIPTMMPKNGFSGEVKGGWTSVDDGTDGAFQATAGANGIVVHADAFSRNADDYDTPNGRQLNSFVDSQGGAIGGSLVGPAGFLGVAYIRNESLYGVPGDEETVEESPRIDLEQDKILSRGEWRVRSMGVEAIRFWFGASDYEHQELAFHHDHGAGPHDDHEEREAHSLFSNKEREARFELQHQAFATGLGELTGALGVQWGHRKIAGLSAEPDEADGLLDPAKTDVIAAFVFEELAVTQRLRLQAAARIEQNDVEGNGIRDALGGNEEVEAFNRSFTPVSASAGALYDIGMGIVARMNAQYVERAPDAAELFSKGVHEATGTFEIGNPDLDIESAKTVELGFKRASGALRFDGSVYYTRFDDFIFKNLTGIECGEAIGTCGAEDELAQIVFGQRDANFYGAELAAQLDVAPIWGGVWGVDGQYDFVRAKFSNGENIQRIPPHRLGGGLYFRNANWFARAGVLHAFDQDKVGLNEDATPGYTLVSAELSYTYKLDQFNGPVPEMTIGIKGENLADDEVLNHASFKRAEGVLEPGASVRIFGSVKLN